MAKANERFNQKKCAAWFQLYTDSDADKLGKPDMFATLSVDSDLNEKS